MLTFYTPIITFLLFSFFFPLLLAFLSALIWDPDVHCSKPGCNSVRKLDSYTPWLCIVQILWSQDNVHRSIAFKRYTMANSEIMTEQNLHEVAMCYKQRSHIEAKISYIRADTFAIACSLNHIHISAHVTTPSHTHNKSHTHNTHMYTSQSHTYIHHTHVHSTIQTTDAIFTFKVP